MDGKLLSLTLSLTLDLLRVHSMDTWWNYDHEVKKMDGQWLHLRRNNNEVFGVEWTLVVCQPLRPPRPCLKSLCSIPSHDTSPSARGAVHGATRVPSKGYAHT